MAESTLYVITTDFNFRDDFCWSEGNVRRSPQEIIQSHKQRYGQIRTNDFLSAQGDFQSMVGLERHLRNRQYSFSIFPCIELKPSTIVLWFSGGLRIEETMTDYDSIQNFIRLVDPRTKEPIVDRRIEGRERIEVVVNYHSNEGIYQPTIERLRTQFSVQEIEIRRERLNVRFEGCTDQEIAEYWKD